MQSMRIKYIRTKQVQFNRFLPENYVKLPSSFPGSPRYMQEAYFDAMRVIQKTGRPTLFITMTTNPMWEEIVLNLSPNQTVDERPDLVCRVFLQKFYSLLEDIYEKKIFGDVQSYVAVIEFQGRGLPHCHITVSLKDDYIPKTPSQIDKFVSARIPDPDKDSILHELVLKHMIHYKGNCYGKPCSKKGPCNRGFPKPHIEETVIGTLLFLFIRRY